MVKPVVIVVFSCFTSQVSGNSVFFVFTICLWKFRAADVRMEKKKIIYEFDLNSLSLLFHLPIYK